MNNEKNIIIKLEDIHKYFTLGGKELQVLKGIDLEVVYGEVVSLVGPSGSGKSTLLSLINGLDKPNLGNIYFDGVNISSFTAYELNDIRNKQISIVFQFYHLLPEFTALENVMMPLLIGGIKKELSRSKALALLEEVGLKDRIFHHPSQLSGGEQQRVAICRALVTEPKIVLADEPTGNLDHTSAEEIYNLILQLNEKKKQTYIIVTHNEQLALKTHRLLWLIDGKIWTNKNF